MYSIYIITKLVYSIVHIWVRNNLILVQECVTSSYQLSLIHGRVWSPQGESSPEGLWLTKKAVNSLKLLKNQQLQLLLLKKQVFYCSSFVLLAPCFNYLLATMPFLVFTELCNECDLISDSEVTEFPHFSVAIYTLIDYFGILFFSNPYFMEF